MFPIDHFFTNPRLRNSVRSVHKWKISIKIFYVIIAFLKRFLFSLVTLFSQFHSLSPSIPLSPLFLFSLLRSLIKSMSLYATKISLYLYVYIHPFPQLRAGSDTRSIFKRCTASLIAEFFFLTGNLTKAK